MTQDNTFAFERFTSPSCLSTSASSKSQLNDEARLSPAHGASELPDDGQSIGADVIIPPPKENAAADGSRGGVEDTDHLSQIFSSDTATTAACHPILALHWGIAA